MIKKINIIKNMAVFENFEWAKTIREKKGNNIGTFNDINIFYGRNYSGKTTISRIFRGLETGTLSEKYNTSEFEVEFTDKKKSIRTI